MKNPTCGELSARSGTQRRLCRRLHIHTGEYFQLFPQSQNSKSTTERHSLKDSAVELSPRTRCQQTVTALLKQVDLTDTINTKESDITAVVIDNEPTPIDSTVKATVNKGEYTIFRISPDGYKFNDNRHLYSKEY